MIQQSIQNIEAPVFIIGGSRTGSELLKNVIRKYSRIDFLPEMFLMSPRWLHKDFVSSSKMVNQKDGQYDVNQILNLIYSKKLYGYFWTVVEELDREMLKKLIIENNSDLKGVFVSLMMLHASKNDKSYIGAKFPVHYSYIDTLKKWFPNAKFIHTVRDPRAIVVSQTKKYFSGKHSFIKSRFLFLIHFMHIIIQTIWTSKVHKRWCNDGNYHIFRYEDYLLAPDQAMKPLCEFLDIEYQAEMSMPEIYSNSSYIEKRGEGKGLDKSSVNSWDARIGPLTRLITEFVCRRSMNIFGYK